MSLRAKSCILFSAAVVVAQALASFLLRPSFALLAISDLAQCVLLFAGVLAFLPNLFATHGRVRLFWTLISLGMALWFSYQVLWTYFEVGLRQDVESFCGRH